MTIEQRETLREAVARAMAASKDLVWHDSVKGTHGYANPDYWLTAADAAIAVIFDRLREPSDGMCKAGYLADDLYPKHLCDNQNELHRCVSEPRWKAMLDAFQQEISP